LVATIEGFVAHRAPADRFLPSSGVDDLYDIEWQAIAALPEQGSSGRRIIAVDRGQGLPELALEAGSGPVTFAVDWRGAGSTFDVAAAHRTAHQALALLQTWLENDAYAATRMIWLTHGVAAVTAEDRVPDLTHALLWGLVRAARAENAQCHLLLLDVDDAFGKNDLERALVLEGEPDLAIRAGLAYAPRFTKSAASSTPLALVTRASCSPTISGHSSSTPSRSICLSTPCFSRMP